MEICDIQNPQKIEQNVALISLLEQVHRGALNWFQHKYTFSGNTEDESNHPLVVACLEIMQNKFRNNLRSEHGKNEDIVDALSLTVQVNQSEDALQRLFDDFEVLFKYKYLPNEHASPVAEAVTPLPPPLNVTQFLRSWVIRCLAARCLSRCLKLLISNKELFEHYYCEDAFLRTTRYAKAFILCLMAVELNKYNLLFQLDIPLAQSPEQLLQKHRRTKSLPSINLGTTPNDTLRRCKTLTTSLESSFVAVYTRKPALQKELPIKRLCSSMSPVSVCSFDELDMLPSTSVRSRSRLSPDSNDPSGSHASMISLSSSASTKPIQLIRCDDIKIWTDQSQEQQEPTASQLQVPENQSKLGKLGGFFANLFGSSPTYTSWSSNYTSGKGKNCGYYDAEDADSFGVFAVNGRKFRKRNAKNLFQDGVSMLDYSTPSSSSTTRCRNSPEISDTKPPMDTTPPKSIAVPSIANRSERQSVSLSLSEVKRQNLTAFLQMSRFSSNNTDIEKENEHFCISEACISAIEHVKWERQKQQADMVHGNMNATNCTERNECQLNSSKSCENVLCADVVDLHHDEVRSAAFVGLTLISRFNDQQLSNKPDVTWLVADNDTPQKLLPMPANFGVDQPQYLRDFRKPPMTRGTKFWAPPRQQIIFTDHPPPNRLNTLQKQNYLCAGCGMHVDKQYLHLFRYCTYLGKYFCTGCHRNQMSLIPSKILQSWDFNCYPVSVFAYRLIEQMYTFPMFYVPDLNQKLYENFVELKMARRSRKQLKYVQDLIKHCRFASKEQSYFDGIPEHIISDPDSWSMSDFVDVHNKSMRRSIEELIELCETHVSTCVLCTGRGFVCEYCRSERVLYLWQNKTQRCIGCGACFHLNCWNSMKKICCRCIRIEKRQSDS